MGKQQRETRVRGYFAIGAEGITKAMNVGSLFRSAHAFGASFMFTVAAQYARNACNRSDTSDAEGQVPFYAFPDVSALVLPRGCDLVGVEITDSAIDLPSFRHPRCAAYVFGPERGGLSPELLARCAFTVRIPTRFSVNVGVAGAIIMYDRTLSLGRYAPRPTKAGAPDSPLSPAVHGGPVLRRKMQAYRAPPPADTGV